VGVFIAFPLPERFVNINVRSMSQNRSTTTPEVVDLMLNDGQRLEARVETPLGHPARLLDVLF
jgi:hypothetical protein